MLPFSPSLLQLTYERGETRQGKALDKLLRLLDRHPELLDEVRVKNAA